MGSEEAVAAATRALGVPYGYTIAVWSANALCMDKYGDTEAQRGVAVRVGGVRGVHAL